MNGLQVNECKSFLEEQIKESLNTAHIKLLDAAPRVANELLKVALDPKTKAYAKVSACESIKDQLSALEGGAPTMIDV